MRKTLGEQRIRTDFNVSGDSAIDVVKMGSAELIDLLEDCKGGGEQARLASLAQTYYEIAAMFAVKAVTYKN